MMYGLAPEHYDALTNIFKKYPLIKKVLLFGSRSIGSAKDYSDFDLAVMAPEMSDQEFSQLWGELDSLPLVFKLDVLHWDKLKNTGLKEKILKEGKDFY